MDGVEILRKLAIKKCKAKIIIISGFDSSVLHSSSMLAKELGLNVVAQVRKPVQAKQIQAIIKDINTEETAGLKPIKANSPIPKYVLFSKEDIENLFD